MNSVTSWPIFSWRGSGTSSESLMAGSFAPKAGSDKTTSKVVTILISHAAIIRFNVISNTNQAFGVIPIRLG
jgi:hypothetical protein